MLLANLPLFRVLILVAYPSISLLLLLGLSIDFLKSWPKFGSLMWRLVSTGTSALQFTFLYSMAVYDLSLTLFDSRENLSKTMETYVIFGVNFLFFGLVPEKIKGKR